MPGSILSVGDVSTAFDLRRFLQVLGRNWWVIAISTVAVVVPAVAWSSSQAPKYRTTAQMVLEPKRSELLYAPGSGATDANEVARSIATEAQRLRGAAVRQAVAKKLGFRADVQTSASGVDSVITVTAESSGAKRAADIANTFVTTYIEYREARALEGLLDAQTEIQAKIDEKQKAIDGIDALVAAAPPDRRGAIAQARAYERSSLANQQNLFRSQVDQLQVAASLSGGGADVLTPAEPPGAPFAPNVGRTGVLAAMAGVLLGMALAFVADFADDSIRDEEDLDRSKLGVPVLGSVPAVRGWRKEGSAHLVSLVDPASSAAEGYRGLRTALQFLAVERPIRVIQVTSPQVSEGKSTATANLAVALARAGQRVIVVCCDLRRPRVHDFFDLPRGLGLTSVLVGDVPLDRALQRFEVEGDDLDLEILASGPLPPNPSELLASERFTQILDAVKARADIVVIDSPPLLPVFDAAVLTASVDATIVVARPGRTTRKSLGKALAVLRRVNAPLVGILLNGVRQEGSYDYDQYHEREPVPGRRRGRGRATRRPEPEEPDQLDADTPVPVTVPPLAGDPIEHEPG